MLFLIYLQYLLILLSISGQGEQMNKYCPSCQVLLAEHFLTTVIVYIHATVTVVHQLMYVTPKVKYSIPYVVYHKPTN
jgi:hypothetical protein